MSSISIRRLFDIIAIDLHYCQLDDAQQTVRLIVEWNSFNGLRSLIFAFLLYILFNIILYYNYQLLKGWKIASILVIQAYTTSATSLLTPATNVHCPTRYFHERINRFLCFYHHYQQDSTILWTRIKHVAAGTLHNSNTTTNRWYLENDNPKNKFYEYLKKFIDNIYEK